MTAGEALSSTLNELWAARVVIDGNEIAGDIIASAVNEVCSYLVGEAFKSSEAQGRRGLNWVVAAGSGDPKSIGTCYRGNSIEIIFGLDSHRYIDFLEAVLARESSTCKPATFLCGSP